MKLRGINCQKVGFSIQSFSKGITMRFSKVFLVLLMLVATSLRAQTGGTSIQYSKLGYSATGIVGYVTYTGANPDSVMTVVKATQKIGNDYVFEATEYSKYQGQQNRVDHYIQSESVKSGWKAAYNFTKGSALGAVYHYTVTREVVDTGLVVIGTTPVGNNFVVTNVIVSGNNDTTGYTSNATVKVGTAAGGYNDIVASATPSLGKPTTAAATLVSPRNDVPGNTAIYLHVTAAAVATTETINVDITGFIR